MSIRSKTLQEFGQRCLNSLFVASVRHGRFIIDCADELERLEADLQKVRTLNAEARGLLDRADQMACSSLLREEIRCNHFNPDSPALQTSEKLHGTV